MKLAMVLLIIFSLASFPCYSENYKPWNESLFIHIKKSYGDEAEKRMRYLHKLIIANQDKTDFEKLTIANNTFNLFPWIADKEQWGKEDHWATPIEIITTFGGDCEDIAFAKWIMLRHLGIPKNKLFFAYVKIKEIDQAHMVLLYKDNPDALFDKATVYVLDNMESDIKLSKERKDLQAVYVFDTSSTIYTIKDDGVKRELSSILKPTHFKNLSDLKARFAKGREELKKANQGEYLLPEL